MTALPTGTVSFLLADVEGATSGWEADREAMAAAIVRHYELLDAAIARHGGVRPDDQGEGGSVVAAFGSASAALRAAVDAQRDLAGQPLRVRIALHTGEAQLRDDGSYPGRAVVRAARLRAAGHGGQILCSRPTADLVRDDLPADVTLLDLGPHRLKDLGRPERVYQVCHPALPREFPRLQSLEEVPNNLPVHLTSFIGREKEQAEVVDLTRRHRLVTLVGAGGSGKTRLAGRVAADLAAGHPDGTWWVELAPLADPALVPGAVLAALRLPDSGDYPPMQRLAAYLATRDVLLVLDNCEHVLSACRALADAVLRGCPGARVIATSREALGVDGELTWQVPGLGMPTEAVAPETLGSYEAVRLFVDRALKARPNFAVDNTTAPVVAEICARLDGIPLAIELAAARVRVLSPQQILDGLVDRFRLLTGGSRTALPRQQTLEASVAWSHDQLGPDERVVFRRLSVFAGGFTLDGAATVCTALQGGPEPVAVLDVLDSLAAKSLILVEEASSAVLRYRMLETLRQFAVLQLDRAGEAAPARNAHSRFFVELAARTEDRLNTVTAAVIREAVVDLDNYRVALDWLVTGSDCAGALTVANAHGRLLNLRGRYRETVDAVQRSLAVPGGSGRTRGLAHSTLGIAQWSLGHFDAVLANAADMSELSRTDDDALLRGRAENIASWVTIFRDPTAAITCLDAGWASLDAADDPWLAMNLTADHLIVVMRADDLPAARVWLARAMAAAQGNEYFLAWNHASDAWVAMRQGELDRAGTAAELAGALARGLGDTTTVSFAAAAAAWADLLAGRVDQAAQTAERALRASEAAGDVIARSSLLAVEAAAAWVGGTADALELASAAVRAAEEIDDHWQRAPAALLLARIHLGRGETAAARTLVEAARHSGQVLGSVAVAASADSAAGCLAVAEGYPERAEDLQHAALSRAVDQGYPLVVVDALEELALLAALGESWAEATRLLAATAARREQLGYRHGRRSAAVEASCRAGLGEAGFVGAWAEGAALEVAEAVAYAARARGARKRPATGWASLTPTELDVARLAATGIGNAAIGEKLFIAAGTVKVHLSHIYAKLDIGNRTQLTALSATVESAGEAKRAAVRVVGRLGPVLVASEPGVPPGSADDGECQTGSTGGLV